MTIWQRLRNPLMALSLVTLLPRLTAPDDRPAALEVVARAADRQTTTEEAAALARPGAVRSVYLQIEIHEINVGRHSGSGDLKRWYLREDGPDGRELVRTSWRDARSKTTDTGRAVYGRAVVEWLRDGATPVWLLDADKHAKDIEQIEDDVAGMRALIDLFLLRKLMTESATFKHVGRGTSAEGRAVWRVRRTAPDERTLDLAIDVETSVLLGVTEVSLKPGDPEREYRLFGEQTTSDGIRIPKQVELHERAWTEAGLAPKPKLLFKGFVDALRFNDPKIELKTFHPDTKP